MKDKDIHKIIRVLKRKTVECSKSSSPFKVLISCLISLRTKDEVTYSASKRLFAFGKTPEKLGKLKVDVIRKAIYPAGFYNVKARNIRDISRLLVEKYDSKVPDKLEELLKIKGIGRKTANLVISQGYGKPGICVDTHVHRISNRLGYVKTKTPDETELVLRKKLPKKYWIIFNNLLVDYGKNTCKPISPICSICKINGYCSKAGVIKYR